VLQRRSTLLHDERQHVEGEMKRYVKDMSGHKFAERGGGILQICVFMTDIHNSRFTNEWLGTFFSDFVFCKFICKK